MLFQTELFKQLWNSKDRLKNGPKMDMIQRSKAQMVEQNKCAELCSITLQIEIETSTKFCRGLMVSFLKNRDVVASFLTELKNFDMVANFSKCIFVLKGRTMDLKRKIIHSGRILCKRFREFHARSFSTRLYHINQTSLFEIIFSTKIYTLYDLRDW